MWCKATSTERLLLIALLVLAPETIGAPEAQDGKVNPFDSFESAESRPAPYRRSQSGPAIDARIQISVTPVIRGPVVDRVVEPSSIRVKAPEGTREVELYLEPVDAPYGGKPLAAARLLGKSTNRKNDFLVSWDTVEQERYVRLFAICRGSTRESSRSRYFDLGMGGRRLNASSLSPTGDR